MERHECVTRCYQIPGQTWPSELCWLYDTCAKSLAHVEIGTFCGRSLMAACGGMSKNSLVVSVDNDCVAWDKQWVKTVRHATLSLIEQEVVEANSGSIEASLRFYNEGLRFDSIFIDACHAYAECKADIEAWLPLLKPGGIISGHDYWTAHTGVMYAVNDVFKDQFKVVESTRIWFARPNIS